MLSVKCPMSEITRITSATILVNCDQPIHTHAILVYGKNPSQSKNYEEYALKVSTRQWTIDSAASGFWGFHRVPPAVYRYFSKHRVSTKPKGFENGVRVQFEFGVAKIFDTGKAILTVSLKSIPRNTIHTTLCTFVQTVHEYIKQINTIEELQWYPTRLDVDKYSWDIVSLNSTGTLFDSRIQLQDFNSFCTQQGIDVFYDPEYHKGYMKVFVRCSTKKNTVCLYHTGKCVIMGVKSIQSLETIEHQMKTICHQYTTKDLPEPEVITNDDEEEVYDYAMDTYGLILCSDSEPESESESD